MLTLIAVLAIVLTFAYIAYLQNQITRKDNLLAQWDSYADYKETEVSDLYSELESVIFELNTIQNKYGYALTSLKIANKVLPVARVKYTENNNSVKPKNRVATQIALFDQTDMFSSADYVPTFDTDGTIVYSIPTVNGNGHKSEVKSETNTKITESEAVDIIANLGMELIKLLGKDELTESESNRAVELVTKWVSEGKSKTQFAQWLADDLKSSSKVSTTESTLFTATDDSTLLKSDKYGQYLDLLLANQGTKKLAQPKYEYAKTMFLKWEHGKNPNTAEEYAKRIINNKFGGK